MGFFAAHLWEVFFGLIAAGSLAFCKYLHNQLKNYKQLLEKKDNEELRKTILDEVSPILDEVHRLAKELQKTEQDENDRQELFLDYYRFRLIQLCRAYLRQQYITQDQYDSLNEFFKLYHGLHGNGQAEEYYDKAMALPIKDNPKKGEIE